MICFKVGLSIVLILALWKHGIAAAQNEAAAPAPGAVDRALNRLYNFDFPGAHSVLDAHLQSNPAEPLGFALRAAAYLFSDYDRLGILEAEFFADDDRVTDKKRLKPDPAARQKIFAATAQARKYASARLAGNRADREALFALCMAAGIETEYSILVEKKYFRSYSLSKETQGYARKLLALNPPFYDAYVTMGAVEYIVANLNFFFRLFVHFEGIEGSRKRAVENLTKAITDGHFYPPYAKILLAVIHLREKRAKEALQLLVELERDFPENPLFRREVEKVSQKLGLPAKPSAK